MNKLKCCICNKIIKENINKSRHGKRSYCSNECRFKGQEMPKRGYHIIGDTALIELPKGNLATIDIIDLDLAELNWYSQKDYVVRKGKDRKYIHMHRIVLERKIGRALEPHEEVDHINGDRLDNTRANLRVSNRSQNCANVTKNNRRSSIFKGVSFSKLYNKYRARITCMGQTIHIGYFENELDAAKAYDKKALFYFGEYANLNFPPHILASAQHGINGRAGLAEA